MAQMTSTLGAMHLRARHAEGAVLARRDRAFLGLIEARPAAAAVVFRPGVEQLLAAACTAERSGAVLAIQGACPGSLGAVGPQHTVLLRGQFATPLLIGLLDLKA